MFRRRRPARRGIISRMMGGADPRLVEANRRLEAGDYPWAAAQFEQLAIATRRPRNAAYLYVEAGRAHLLGGQIQPAMRLFRYGLNLLAERGRYIRLGRLGRRVVRLLHEHGNAAQADEIAAWLNGQPGPERDISEDAAVSAEAGAGAPAAAPAAAQSAKKARLPLKCPSCGGTVDPRD